MTILVEVTRGQVKCPADVRLRTACFVGVSKSRPVTVQPAPGIGCEIIEVLQETFSYFVVKADLDCVIVATGFRRQRLAVWSSVTAGYQAVLRAICGGLTEAWITDDVLFVLISIKHADVLNSAHQPLVRITNRANHVGANAVLACDSKLAREHRLNIGIDAFQGAVSGNRNGTVIDIDELGSQSTGVSLRQLGHVWIVKLVDVIVPVVAAK